MIVTVIATMTVIVSMSMIGIVTVSAILFVGAEGVADIVAMKTSMAGTDN
ncbi:hypothetical protein MUB24_07000 [Lederbergia sp. NSJ-179]|uniref:NADH dehydrogenase subunit 3 n=1 Tax=Lederbergia ruris TaxID=217495 RepID=A0ABQ4KLJ5_9BACI|nr:hypothetical protein [Lederbergia sp. NSJ-179]MCJ7840659.1 hypothetical protein [Lederbergia sp. NSJ-179]GIN58820.1 hypothetical protein J8TS2_31390 [Lederbergia ruris]